MKYKVEVWEVHEFFIEVEADNEDAATDEATRILAEMSPENFGCEYGDRWTDVIEAEAKA